MYQLAELSTICEEFGSLPCNGNIDDQNYTTIMMIIFFRREIEALKNFKQTLSYNT